MHNFSFRISSPARTWRIRVERGACSFSNLELPLPPSDAVTITFARHVLAVWWPKDVHLHLCTDALASMHSEVWGMACKN